MERWRAWFDEKSNERLLLLDIGSGYNTPGVVRWPMEQIAMHVPTARFVRINLHDAGVPSVLGARALRVQADARQTTEAIVSALEGV